MLLFTIVLILPGLVVSLSVHVKEKTHYDNEEVKVFDVAFPRPALLFKMFDIYKTNTQKTAIDDVPEFDELQEYVSHLKKAGSVILKSLGEKIETQIKTEKNIIATVNTLYSDYVKALQNYSKEVFALNTYNIDTDYTFLDILETACKLIYDQQKKLLVEVIKEAKSDASSVLVRNRQIEIEISRQTKDFKNEEIAFICNSYGICRTHSDFTNFFLNFLNELLGLTNDKFATIIRTIMSAVQQSNEFWEMISEMEISEQAADIVASLYINTDKVKEILTELRTIFRQRFYIFGSSDFEHKTRVQAVRSVLDIIDKSFHSRVDSEFLSYLNKVAKDLKKWSYSVTLESPLNEEDLLEFVNKLFRSFNLNPDSMKEGLINIILDGSSGNADLSKIVFRNGFNGVYLKKKEK